MLPVETIPVPEKLQIGLDEAIVLSTSTQTNGDFFALELHMAPGGGAPVMHSHAPSEVYRVLSGQFTFYVTHADGRTTRRTAGAGETVTLAGDTPHTIRNETSDTAVAFCVHAPGAAMEGFTRAAAALAATGTPSMDDVLAVAHANGIRLLGPAPA